MKKSIIDSLNRRQVIAGAMTAGLAGAGWRSQADASGLKQFGLANYLAQTFPDDAATPEHQTFVVVTDPTIPKVLDFYEAVYERPGVADLFSDPLVRFTRNFEIIPGAAESWSSDESGKVWTFKIKQGLMWNDGNPVTAEDWLATFRYAADPGHAWDFSWYFAGKLTNWNEAIAGEVPTDQIGVSIGANEYELVFETIDAAPYLPSMLLYSMPLSKVALETHGPLYNTKPETHVSSGPFKLQEWVPDEQIVVVKNDQYTGTLQVPVTKVICKLAAPTTTFSLYQTDEIDMVEGPAPQELAIAQADPDLSQQLYAGVGDFKTFYLFFDVTKEPFTDLRVRQAFSHIIDREALVSSIIGIGGTEAYSFLAPGFPGADRDGLKSIQNYDPDLGRQLLADAGYPNGEGFPKLEMWLRAATPLDQNISAALAAMITEQLGIECETSNRDQASYMASLTAKPTEIPFGYVSYGMDYLDPSNMLGVFQSGGRHSWSNPDFDAKLTEAAAFIGDPDERLAMFHEAERILVTDVPAVFIYHVKLIQLIKPWLKGEFKEPDINGIAAMHWPSYTTMSTVTQELYIGSDAPNR
jgi:peptide/nickel transport system substrate-binding protein/oligopeptide transport system substrate-binding protein